MKLLGFIAVFITGVLLFIASGDFPAWGDPASPANASEEVSQRYIQDAYKNMKTPNIVTAVLADYRGFDTMFETCVILVAGIAIISVLSVIGNGTEPRDGGIVVVDEKPNIIVIQTCKLVIPVLQLFALYVVAHGHYSPGGGFQGGVMLGASLILMALASGLPVALKRLSEKRAIVLAVIGIIIYAGWGFVCLLMGGNFLNYGMTDAFLPGDAASARSYGALIVEIGVACTVTAIMFAIYANLATRGRLKGGL